MKAERIVVRAPNWLGDVVMSLAALRDIRRHFPKARIEMLARESVSSVYGAVPEIDAVRTSRGVREDGRALRGEFDLALLLPNSFGTALAPWLAGIPERWGYATDMRSLLLTRRTRVPKSVRGQSQVYYYRAMLAGVGIDTSAPPDAALRCPDEWRRRGAALTGGSPTIALSPGAAFGTAKRWLPERFAAAADALGRRRGASAVIVGTAKERPLGEWIAERMTVPTRVLCGQTTLPELVGILAASQLLLTNDSGSMHVAAALGTPLVAVFGPTDWRETSPFGARTAVVREDAHCAPCMLRECPIDHRCMERVSVAHVLSAAEAL
jgi:heptosyltransferase-2